MKTSVDLKIKNIVFQHAIVILIGIVIFYIDEIEFLDKFYPKLILILVAMAKSVYFISHSFKKIEEASVKNHTYTNFLIVIMTNIFLIILSFAVDYTCLYQFDKGAFRGIIYADTLVDSFFDFLYFSVLTFTTTGFGDIIPITKSSKALVTMQVIVAFITTIIVISNFVHIKDSIKDLSFLKIRRSFLNGQEEVGKPKSKTKESKEEQEVAE